VITDMEHPHLDLQQEMADLWPGFAREHLRHWLLDAGLSQVVVEDLECTCCAGRMQEEAMGNREDQEIRMNILVATGLKPDKAVY